MLPSKFWFRWCACCYIAPRLHVCAAIYIYIYIYIFDHCSRVIPTSYDAIVEMNDKGVGMAHVILFLSVLQLVFPQLSFLKVISFYQRNEILRFQGETNEYPYMYQCRSTMRPQLQRYALKLHELPARYLNFGPNFSSMLRGLSSRMLIDGDSVQSSFDGDRQFLKRPTVPLTTGTNVLPSQSLVCTYMYSSFSPISNR